MSRMTQSVTGIGVSHPMAVEWRVVPFSCSATLYLGAGCSASIQYTCDNIQDNNYDPSTGKWLNHPDATNVIGAGVTAGFLFPVVAIRLNQTSGSATSTLVVLQGGNT